MISDYAIMYSFRLPRGVRLVICSEFPTTDGLAS
jgi:hypothetical protein